MLKLMKLEWTKHQLTRYFIPLLICCIGIYGFVVFMALDSKHNGELINFADFMTIAYILSNIVFIIFGGVLLSRLIISEFKTKTMQVMFTYPVSRKKIMLAKLSIVFFYTAACLFICVWFMQGMTFFLQPSLGLFEGSLSVSDLISSIPKTITNAFTMGAIALISLFFGMRKKSTATAITSATLIAFLINSTFTSSSSSLSFMDLIGIPFVLGAIGILIAYLAFRKIDVQDID